jgi:two-component system, chemotaxis family, sensor kinase CheA
MSGGDYDLSRFRDVFFEEAAEHIAEMESGLLELEDARDARGALDRVFRAAHSIKGGAGMFGCDDVVRFAHGFESLLGSLREHPTTPPRTLIDLLLHAADILKATVAAALHGNPAPEGLEEALQELERTRTQALPSSQDECHPSVCGHPPDEGTGTRDRCPSVTGDVPQTRLWHLRFRPAPDVFQTGMDPLLVVRDLTEAGALRSVRLDASALPPLEQLDPGECYLAWEMELESSRSESEIRDVFAFVEDGAEITLARLESPFAPAAVPIASSPVPATAAATNATTPNESPRNGAAAQPSGAPERASIRVSTGKIDKLVDLAGELVIAQSVASQILSHFSISRLAELVEAFAEMERNTRELQERIMAVRMQPIGSVFSRMPRLVRDLAAATAKQVCLQVSGEETELDKSVIERLADPLTHLIRNAVDHGMEEPEQRVAAGKPPEGIIRLEARHEGGNILVEVADDGRGLDHARIREKAVQAGLVAADESLTDEEIASLIFRAGFSTAERVTGISGRGVGMDVVKRNIAALNGSVVLRSVPGKGVTFRMKLPLTLAILDGLLVQVGEERYVLPLVVIVESIRPRPEQVKRVVGQGEVVIVRGEALPLLRLHRLFHVPDAVQDPCGGSVVIVENEGRQHALLVDGLLGQQQVVIKNLETHFRRVGGAMGATILGDGRAALILDAAGLVRMSAQDSRLPPLDAGVLAELAGPAA